MGENYSHFLCRNKMVVSGKGKEKGEKFNFIARENYF